MEEESWGRKGIESSVDWEDQPYSSLSPFLHMSVDPDSLVIVYVSLILTTCAHMLLKY